MSPVLLLFSILLGDIAGELTEQVFSFGKEVLFDLFRHDWLREPFYSYGLAGCALGDRFVYAAGIAFFIRLLSSDSWKVAAAWAFGCHLLLVLVSIAWPETFSRAFWDMRHAPWALTAIALGCVAGAWACERWEDDERVGALREFLRRVVISVLGGYA